MKRQKIEKTEEVFDDAPPVLVPEENSATEEVIIGEETPQDVYADESTYALGKQYFVDNGVLYQKPQYQTPPSQNNTLEFNFYDANNICCGLCGEVVPYEALLEEHLPIFHPEVLHEGVVDLEEIPYEAWLQEKMQNDVKPNLAGTSDYKIGYPYYDTNRPVRSTRTLRRISQIRVNTNEMSLPELDQALSKKMVEKMGRKVPVTLVDKQHARCGICGSIVSLNKKFEVVHLVRHFNAWHPSAHKCAGTWISKKDNFNLDGTGKPLSTQDFAVIDTNVDAAENLQCIWCGMFMDGKALAMHFHEVHPEEIEVPKCNLCLQEIVINARFTEKYGEDFNITLPDEHHLRCGKFDTKHTSEAAMDKAIARHLTNSMNGGVISSDFNEDDDPSSSENKHSNKSRRSKPKRQFIQPALRQAIPVNSAYVEEVDDCHWRCRICKADILAAVISAGAIRHYRSHHPSQLQNMQYELCKARIERVSDGCMEFLNVDTIECLICNMTFPLHRPFNMCRAIRHLKAKHPEKMPEYNGGHEVVHVNKMRKRKFDNISRANVDGILNGNTAGPSLEEMEEGIMYARELIDPAELETLRQQYNVEFEKVYEISGKSLPQQIYVLMNEGEELNEENVQQVVNQVGQNHPDDGAPIVVQYSKDQDEEQEICEEIHRENVQNLEIDTYMNEQINGNLTNVASSEVIDGVVINIDRHTIIENKNFSSHNTPSQPPSILALKTKREKSENVDFEKKEHVFV